MRKFAGPLTDVSKLRFQAVFMMGAGGSGKGYVGQRWMKYMPGAPPEGVQLKHFEEKAEEQVSEMERGLTNLDFEKAVQNIKDRYGLKIELVDAEKASIPFRLYSYDDRGRETEVKPEEWAAKLPPAVYQEVQGLTDIVFGTPVHEIPSYWRQVNPDLYKEELAGYLADQPGWVHEMSSEMSKAYFEAAVQTGDPVFVDTTGNNAGKMKAWMETAKKNGYRVALVFVFVPLTVNQIRNATRPRKVKPAVVTSQWKRITQNYKPLASVADHAQVVVNRNDSADIAKWKKHGPEIDAFVRADGQYDSLYELISKEAPKELSDWGRVIQPGAGASPRQDRIEELRGKFDRDEGGRLRRRSFRIGNVVVEFVEAA